MKVNRYAWAKAGLISCFLACLGDIFSVPVFARSYPGYNPIAQPLSVLGATGSPVARVVSLIWIAIGLLFLVFAIGFALNNYTKLPAHNVAAWLIAIYGLGEEIGSGIFPGNHLAGNLTVTGWIHNFLGGAGMAALMFLPPVLLKKFKRPWFIFMHHLCLIITITGLLIFAGFTISHISALKGGKYAAWHGLFQRLWVVNYYIFMMAIAVNLFIEARKIHVKENQFTSTA